MTIEYKYHILWVLQNGVFCTTTFSEYYKMEDLMSCIHYTFWTADTMLSLQKW